jgi:hypothetical protein
MGGAKRYPSIFVYESDGFRKGLNPSDMLTTTVRITHFRATVRQAGLRDDQDRADTFLLAVVMAGRCLLDHPTLGRCHLYQCMRDQRSLDE